MTPPVIDRASPPRRTVGAMLLPLLLFSLAASAEPAALGKKLAYPATRREASFDVHHGAQVPTPYRWLEDVHGADARAWTSAQNQLARDTLDQLPGRKTIKDRLVQLFAHERRAPTYGAGGGRTYFTRNTGLQEHDVLYVNDPGAPQARVLIDPNQHGGRVAIAGQRFSGDGKYVAYGLSHSGSDWIEWKLKDVASGIDLPDHISWSKARSIQWSPDHRGFYYTRFPEPRPGQALAEANYNESIWYHKVGTPQHEDRPIFSRRDEKGWRFWPSLSRSGHHLLVTASGKKTGGNRFFYLDLQHPGAPPKKLIDDFDHRYSLVHQEDGQAEPKLWFLTNRGAPNYRLVTLDPSKPGRKRWREILPESKHRLDGISVVNKLIAATYLEDARHVVRLFDLDGKPQGELTLPGKGTIGDLRAAGADALTFTYTDYLTPLSTYRFDLKTRAISLVGKRAVDFDASGFESTQAFVTSKDGTRVPVTLTHKKGLVLDGKNPTYLYGYGGFDNALTPAFSSESVPFLEAGGVMVHANLRGGGEYGDRWHHAGTKLSKQNVFDDFISTAEWLISSGYTSPQKLAIAGGSNGGLLVGAAMTQRPELFKAALPAVGVMDMLRYEQFTLGPGWQPDYGTVKDPAEFAAMKAYSPLHNLKDGTRYPATLITTGTHDDRVHESHSYKFTAALQAAQASDAPVLLSIGHRTGHGSTNATSKKIDSAADRWAFVMHELGMQPAAPRVASQSVASAPAQ